MDLLSIALCAGFAVLACDVPTLCQSPTPNSPIRSVEANRYIGVRIEIHAKDAPLVIPICGSNVESGEHRLCGLASRLQVRTSNGWRPVTVRKGLAAELGGVARGVWKPLRIEPGNTEFLVYSIDPELLDVRRGDQLRFELNTRSSEASMRISDSENRLTTPPFECP